MEEQTIREYFRAAGLSPNTLMIGSRNLKPKKSTLTLLSINTDVVRTFDISVKEGVLESNLGETNFFGDEKPSLVGRYIIEEGTARYNGHIGPYHVVQIYPNSKTEKGKKQRFVFGNQNGIQLSSRQIKRNLRWI